MHIFTFNKDEFMAMAIERYASYHIQRKALERINKTNQKYRGLHIFHAVVFTSIIISVVFYAHAWKIAPVLLVVLFGVVVIQTSRITKLNRNSSKNLADVLAASMEINFGIAKDAHYCAINFDSLTAKELECRSMMLAAAESNQKKIDALKVTAGWEWKNANQTAIDFFTKYAANK